VDDKLRQLKGGESQAGWVFLSLLHGLTSSPLPDPFTLVTGTERAFQILQSGNCWSCSPYEGETLRNLDYLLRLVPQRDYYPPTMKTMETVKWHPHLSPYTAHDGYLLLVQKLIQDSERLKFLFPETTEGTGCGSGGPGEEPPTPIIINPLDRSQLDLCLKAYWRRIALSTEVGRISVKFDPRLSSPHLTPAPLSDLSLRSEVMDDVLTISQHCHNWTPSPPRPNSSGLLKDLLLTGRAF
jgi:hypothetical protein